MWKTLLTGETIPVQIDVCVAVRFGQGTQFFRLVERQVRTERFGHVSDGDVQKGFKARTHQSLLMCSGTAEAWMLWNRSMKLESLAATCLSSR